jgi:hypothetical protein
LCSIFSLLLMVGSLILFSDILGSEVFITLLSCDLSILFNLSVENFSMFIKNFVCT